jgi:hypothetical protein
MHEYSTWKFVFICLIPFLFYKALTYTKFGPLTLCSTLSSPLLFTSQAHYQDPTIYHLLVTFFTAELSKGMTIDKTN